MGKESVSVKFRLIIFNNAFFLFLFFLRFPELSWQLCLIQSRWNGGAAGALDWFGFVCYRRIGQRASIRSRGRADRTVASRRQCILTWWQHIQRSTEVHRDPRALLIRRPAADSLLLYYQTSALTFKRFSANGPQYNGGPDISKESSVG